MLSSDHSTLSLPFSVRADIQDTPPLTSYLLHLISIKRSNLCVSADVHSTSSLLRLAEEVGDYICVLKTHADIIDDFSEKTIKGLREISTRKNFLIFEDRKFGDIGNTVQSQYTRGPLAIATWAHLTNAHIFPGPSIITALHSAANTTLTSLNQSVSTEISAGTPRHSLDSDDNDEENDISSRTGFAIPTPEPHHSRKNSYVTATTTISQTFEPSTPTLGRSFSAGGNDIKPHDRKKALQELGPPPHARGLLLLAEMSSEGNLMTGAYTQACVSAARANPDFVLGFISQHSLNQEPQDAFLNFTPGVSLPPEEDDDDDDEEEDSHQPRTRSDGLGQRWRTPREVICKEGVDIIIVGRGILGANHRASEAERYRKEAWKAYEIRIGRRGKR